MTTANPDDRYVLTLDPKQARIVIAALDLYSRIGMRQLEEIGSVLSTALNRTEEDHVVVRGAFAMFRAAKEILGFVPGESLGIFHAPHAARVAWDVQQVLRKAVADREDHDRLSVWRDAPLPAAHDVPLATCRVSPGEGAARQWVQASTIQLEGRTLRDPNAAGPPVEMVDVRDDIIIFGPEEGEAELSEARPFMAVRRTDPGDMIVGKPSRVPAGPKEET